MSQCEKCQEEISEERLEEHPNTRLCDECVPKRPGRKERKSGNYFAMRIAPSLVEQIDNALLRYKEEHGRKYPGGFSGFMRDCVTDQLGIPRVDGHDEHRKRMQSILNPKRQQQLKENAKPYVPIPTEDLIAAAASIPEFD